MKAELEPEDIEVIAERVIEGLRPLLECKCMQEQDKLLSIEEAADFLRTSKDQIYQWVSNSRHGLLSSPMPFQKAGKRLIFSRRALLEWTARGNRAR